MTQIDTAILIIAESGTTSNAIDIRDKTLVALITPSALTGTAFTFKISMDNSTFVDLYDTDGNAVSVTAAASRHIAISPIDFTSARYLQVVSGSSEAAARTITAVMRAV